jgi:hypothetical protein
MYISIYVCIVFIKNHESFFEIEKIHMKFGKLN